jgi:hypothetical protein
MNNKSFHEGEQRWKQGLEQHKQSKTCDFTRRTNSVFCFVVSSHSGLFAVNLDCDVRTGDRAQGAPDAFLPLILEKDRPVPPGVVFVGWGDQALFTGMDAQMAFLAKLPVDRDVSLQLSRLLYSGFLQDIVCD